MSASSNFFRVKDEAAFLTWAKNCNLSVREEGSEGDRTFSIFVDNGDEYDIWPISGYDPETKEHFDVEVYSDVARQLQDDCVAVLFEVGGMDGDRPYAYVEAVNNQGKALKVNFNDIYAHAKKLGKEVL